VKWVRTFPAGIPEGRNYVVDQIERVHMERHKYVPVFGQLGGDTVIIEWDLAVDPEMMAAFEARVADDPCRVQVAPYRLYPVSSALPGPVWAHRHVINPSHAYWVAEGDPCCGYFGLGLVYLPHAVVRAYLETGPEVASDQEFSRWHHENVEPRVPIHWDVRPVHLHY
jgi:hypothetical protein